MVKIHKLHKFSGISAGLLLLILSISGIFLDHDKWNFLYSTTFSNVPSQTLSSEQRLFTSYYVDKDNPKHILVGGHRGLFESFNKGKRFSNISTMQILSIISYDNTLYLATSNGIYSYTNKSLQPLALQGNYITSLSLSKKVIVAVIDKEKIVTLNRHTLAIVNKSGVKIPKELLQKDIKLSRLIRDLHYGRGIFDGDISLLINDYGAIILSCLSLSGYLIWWLIYLKKYGKISRKLIKTHANIFSIFAIFPLIILAITGIFLDHSNALANFMKSVNISHSILPPVYNSLQSDIWSIDYDGKIYRVGNRYGIYKSQDLKTWQLDNRGFAYKMIRENNRLYISGMGAPNRVLQNSHYKILPNTPHMFRDVIIQNAKPHYFSTMKKEFQLPEFKTITLYSLLLTLHDGTFFSSWWIWINDFSALALLLLCVTGALRWYKKKFS
ncbi:PepSY-associated TM helix domain-containing protein [Sulfurimonas sp.]